MANAGATPGDQQTTPSEAASKSTLTQLNLANPKNAQRVFSHRPLNDAGRQIRLLRFLDRASPDIHFDVCVFSLGEAPEFVAISYVWGEEEPDRTITVEGKDLRVRPNCWYALQQARSLQPLDHVWIDAICINQHDTAEKSQQVQMMGDIYASASATLICIGEHDDSSCCVFDAILDDGGSRPSRTSGDSFAQLCAAVNTLGQRPYWRRLWIIQEARKSSCPLLACGMQLSIPLSGLSRLVQSFPEEFRAVPREFVQDCEDGPRGTGDLSVSRSLARKYRKHQRPVLIESPMIRILDPLRSGQAGRTLRETGVHAERLDIVDLVRVFRNQRCAIARDKIFALLGIADNPPKLRIDYDCTALELALNVLHAHWAARLKRQPGLRYNFQIEYWRLVLMLETLKLLPHSTERDVERSQPATHCILYSAYTGTQQRRHVPHSIENELPTWQECDCAVDRPCLVLRPILYGDVSLTLGWPVFVPREGGPETGYRIIANLIDPEGSTDTGMARARATGSSYSIRITHHDATKLLSPFPHARGQMGEKPTAVSSRYSSAVALDLSFPGWGDVVNVKVQCLALEEISAMLEE